MRKGNTTSLSIWLQLAVLAHEVACVAVKAQIVVPPAPNNGSCSLTYLYERVSALNLACCSNATDCPRGVPLMCSPACGAVLTPLMDECDGMLDLMFDTTDGNEDSTAGIFRDLQSRCNAVPSADILTALRSLVNAGHCPEEWMEGVGNSAAVASFECSDSRANCLQLISVLSCASDFCHET
eukprot:COSAG01_NODE_21445_length_902_cov_0.777086_1_plen_181_part_01